VAAALRGRFELAGLGAPRSATLAGRMEKAAASALELPTVGDWVACRPQADALRIERILPRRSCFVRKAAGRDATPQLVAANVDQVLAVTAVGEDFSVRRLQRYAAAAWAGGAEPICVINKCDREHDRAALRAEIESALPGVPVAFVSALEPGGLDELSSIVHPPSTLVFVGSSGVGKSTLCNRWMGVDLFGTAGVRAADDKGRHTTTRRELVISPQGFVLIDTPGMRELGVWEADSGIATLFSDVEELSASCRFRDCAHAAEPGCAVRGAVEAGLLPAERLAQFQALASESAETSLRHRERDAHRSIRRVQRQRQKLHKKLGLKED
jgi:ribosome biogenesis GTPase